MTRLLVLRESDPAEKRVAVVPADLPKLLGFELDVVVEPGAGEAAGHPDGDYQSAGATLGDGHPGATLAGDDLLVVKVRPPSAGEVSELPGGCGLLSFLPSAPNLALVGKLRDRGITCLSFDLVPRTSRAQSADALSSQAGVVGYQAALLGAHRLGRMFPMLMTAAGTVAPAKVFVMGAGVAGLQAIATSKRLGAAVNAYDVRPEAAEEVRSLGARFVELDLHAAAGAGGYAAEQSHEFILKQQELVAATVAGSDVVITTAAVPGRPAPKLVTEAMVAAMRPGSVIVDIASASGGNCEITVDGREIDHRGVAVIGAGNLASDVATTASSLYSRNVTNLVALLVHDGKLDLDTDDEIVRAMCVTRGGTVRHEATRAMMEGVAE